MNRLFQHVHNMSRGVVWFFKLPCQTSFATVLPSTAFTLKCTLPSCLPHSISAHCSPKPGVGGAGATAASAQALSFSLPVRHPTFLMPREMARSCVVKCNRKFEWRTNSGHMIVQEGTMKHQAHKPTLLNGSSISISHGHSRVVAGVEFFLLNLSVSVPGYMTLLSLIW